MMLWSYAVDHKYCNRDVPWQRDRIAGDYLVHGRVMRPPTVLGPPLPTIIWHTSEAVPNTCAA